MNLLSNEIEQAASNLAELSTKVPNRIAMINKEISLCDKEESDIKHKIEFGKLNAFQGWQIYKDFQITLQKRRELKDELVTLERVAERINSQKPLTAHASTLAQSIRSREQFKESRTYSVRVRKDFVNKSNIVARN